VKNHQKKAMKRMMKRKIHNNLKKVLALMKMKYVKQKIKIKRGLACKNKNKNNKTKKKFWNIKNKIKNRKLNTKL
jgi:hypothetical protein